MTSLNHIGIACSDPESLQKLFRILSLQKGQTETVKDQGVEVTFFEGALRPVHLELLDPIDPNCGPVAEFLKKKGPGIHHLSFLLEAGQLESTCDELRRNGFLVLYSTSKLGAQGMNINFIHPKSCSGILIELMEPSRLNK